MISRIARILGFAAALAGASATAAPTEVLLRPQISVEDREIRLGDMFDNLAPAVARTIVTTAPAPGERLYVRPSYLSGLLRQHGLTWQPEAGLKAIQVVRTGRIVPRTEILSALSEALQPYVSVSPEELRLAGRRTELVVANDADIQVRVDEIDYDSRSGQFSALIAAPAADPAAERTRIQGQILRMNMVPVLKSRITPGEVISKSDVEWKEMRAERVGRDIVTQIDELVGQSPKRMLMPGMPVRGADIQRPELVVKGTLVTMTLTAPGMMLSATGRAIESGANGDTVQVMNLQSKKTISATVIGRNQVQVTSQVTVLSQASR